MLHVELVVLLVLLIAAQIIIGVSVSAKENRHEGFPHAMAMMPELLGVETPPPIDRREVREIKSETGHARNAVKAGQIFV